MVSLKAIVASRDSLHNELYPVVGHCVTTNSHKSVDLRGCLSMFSFVGHHVTTNSLKSVDLRVAVIQCFCRSRLK